MMKGPICPYVAAAEVAKYPKHPTKNRKSVKNSVAEASQSKISNCSKNTTKIRYFKKIKQFCAKIFQPQSGQPPPPNSDHPQTPIRPPSTLRSPQASTTKKEP